MPWALDLCREVGIDGELVHPAARDAYVWSRGALRPLPPQLMGVPTDLDALEASGLVSAAGIARAREDLTAPATPLHGRRDRRRGRLDGGSATRCSSGSSTRSSAASTPATPGR